MFRRKKRKLQNELNIDINFAEKPVLRNGNPDSRRHATKNLKESCSENQQNSIGKSEKM